MVRALVSLTALVLLVSLPYLAADEPVFSGPQPGEKLTPFKVQGALGKWDGREVELLAEVKKAPALLIFIHEWTRPTLQLARPLDHYATRWAKEGLAAHFIHLTADRSKTEQFLRTAEKSLNLKSPLSISVDGIEGPGNLGLNRKMTVTILVAKDDKVVANFAIAQPNETDAPKVLAAVAQMLGKTAPTAAEIQAELGKGAKRPDPAAKNNPPPELATLMRRMIQKDNDAKAVKEVSDAMTRWAGADAAKQRQLQEYCKKVLDLGYGTDQAKQALRLLAGK